MSATQQETYRPFSIEVEPERESVRVCPCGELDLATVGLLRERVEELTSAGFGRLMLDLREVTFIDLTGVRLIAELARSAQAEGWELGVVEGGRDVRRAFERTGLRRLVPLLADVGPQLTRARPS